MDEMNLQYLEKLKKKTSTRFLIFSELEGGVVGGGPGGGGGSKGGGITTPLTKPILYFRPGPPPPAGMKIKATPWGGGVFFWRLWHQSKPFKMTHSHRPQGVACNAHVLFGCCLPQAFP